MKDVVEFAGSGGRMSKVQFRATVPDIQSALKFGSKIGRVTFEIPESDVPDAVSLIALQGVGLKVTVELDDCALTRTNENDKGKTKGGTEADSKQANRRAARNPLGVAGG